VTGVDADDRHADRLEFRRAESADGDGIGDVWLTSWRATYDFPPAKPDDDVRRWLARELVPNRETWVAADPDEDGRLVGLMALSETMVDQLYVAPDWIGRGGGRRFLELAKERRPDGFELYCFVANANARRFYERHGLTAVAFGDGSNNMEGQPDVRYAWRPSA
jgi:GNAT superfamily N-acetyltransferase